MFGLFLLAATILAVFGRLSSKRLFLKIRTEKCQKLLHFASVHGTEPWLRLGPWYGEGGAVRVNSSGKAWSRKCLFTHKAILDQA